MKFNKVNALEDFLSYAKQKYNTYGEPTWLRIYNDWLAEEIEYEIKDGWCGSDTCFEDHKHKEMRQRINDYLEDA